jgi:aspartyl-tRNA(Asn)/glutamyl-tRNA(Gln) amidotransferase subunit B
MTSYTPTIGLEIHAELKTATKMFCNSANDADEREPNVNICPVCMGHPGTLPVINKEAVRHVLRVGLALGGTLAAVTEFDRKNYFYPDIPKGYQISQYKHPLVSGGMLAGVAITRVHLEEDTARSTHEDAGSSLVDFNRAGVPLMELVTEPVIRSADEAARFAREFQLLLQYLGASDANLEKGEMRIEANVSVSPTDALGTKVEVKNLNSFGSAMRAIHYEIARQTAMLQKGDQVAQETRGWNEVKGETYAQRRKENSNDYRYFPDPDLPKLILKDISEFSEEALRADIPELPEEKRQRYSLAYDLKSEDTEVFVRDQPLGFFFERVASSLGGDTKKIQTAANYVISDLLGLVRADADNLGIESANLADKMPAEHFARLIEMAAAGTVSSRGAKDTLAIMYREGGEPEMIAEKNGLLQQSDSAALRELAKRLADEHPQIAAEYKAGKTASLQYLVGQGMKLSKGSANPEVLRRELEALLSETV